ncbi:MAG: hypothetical protein WCB11_25095, partial [Terriglobales bacterium]
WWVGFTTNLSGSSSKRISVGTAGEIVKLWHDFRAKALLYIIGASGGLVGELCEHRPTVEEVPVQDFFVERDGPDDLGKRAVRFAPFPEQHAPIGQPSFNNLFN